MHSQYIFLKTLFCILNNSYRAVTNMRKRYQSHDDLVITNYWEFLCLSFLQIVAKGYSQDFLPQWLKCKCIVSIKRRSWNNWFSEFTHTHIIIQSIFAPFSNETCNGKACKSYYIDRIEDFTIQLTQSNHFISLNAIMIFCGSCNLYL